MSKITNNGGRQLPQSCHKLQKKIQKKIQKKNTKQETTFSCHEVTGLNFEIYFCRFQSNLNFIQPSLDSYINMCNWTLI